MKIPAPYSRRQLQLGVLVALGCFIFDQLSKMWIVEMLHLVENRQGIDILPFFKLVMVWNAGISFGMFADAGELRRWTLIGVAAIITLVMFAWLWKSRNTVMSLALGLVIGGAVGNIIDRLRWGAVADFFYFYYESWYWPAFNIADSAIFIGVVLLCWDSIVNPEKPT